MKKETTNLTSDDIELVARCLISRRFDLSTGTQKRLAITIALPGELITIKADQLVGLLDILNLGLETLQLHRQAAWMINRGK